MSDINELLKTGCFSNPLDVNSREIAIRAFGAASYVETTASMQTPPETIRSMFMVLLRIGRLARMGSTLGIAQRINWIAPSNTLLRTQTLDIPDTANSVWWIHKGWSVSWRPHEIGHWKDKWYETASFKVEIHDAKTNRLLKELTLDVKKPDDGFSVDDEQVRSVSERLLDIWGKIYLIVQACGFDGQFWMEYYCFDEGGLTDDMGLDKAGSTFMTDKGYFVHDATELEQETAEKYDLTYSDLTLKEFENSNIPDEQFSHAIVFCSFKKFGSAGIAFYRWANRIAVLPQYGRPPETDLFYLDLIRDLRTKFGGRFAPGKGSNIADPKFKIEDTMPLTQKGILDYISSKKRKELSMNLEKTFIKTAKYSILIPKDQTLKGLGFSLPADKIILSGPSKGEKTSSWLL